MVAIKGNRDKLLIKIHFSITACIFFPSWSKFLDILISLQVLDILDNIHDKINSAMELGDSVSRVQYLIRIHEELQNDGKVCIVDSVRQNQHINV